MYMKRCLVYTNSIKASTCMLYFYNISWYSLIKAENINISPEQGPLGHQTTCSIYPLPLKILAFIVFSSNTLKHTRGCIDCNIV